MPRKYDLRRKKKKNVYYIKKVKKHTLNIQRKSCKGKTCFLCFSVFGTSNMMDITQKLEEPL